MINVSTPQKIYIAAMVAAYVVLDLVGVSNGDKLALSAIFGVVAPVCFPQITKQIFVRPVLPK